MQALLPSMPPRPGNKKNALQRRALWLSIALVGVLSAWLTRGGVPQVTG